MIDNFYSIAQCNREFNIFTFHKTANKYQLHWKFITGV